MQIMGTNITTDYKDFLFINDLSIKYFKLLFSTHYKCHKQLFYCQTEQQLSVCGKLMFI
jgi:hypothetical protein